MKLSDLRKATVKRRIRIRFPLSNGMECVLNEHGIAQVPALHAVPAFNLEDELAGVEVFVVETVGGENDKNRPKARNYTRNEMMAFAAAGGPAEVAHEDHDD